MPPSLGRVRVRVRGTVQGVGFRPFVHRRATALGLAGWVGNDGGEVVLEAEGDHDAIAALVRAVTDDAPALALVERVDVTPQPATGEHGFRIVVSAGGAGTDVRVSADVAPCAPCLAEVADPSDRRFGYPFANCTDCGPRWSIVTGVPYDRATTTMQSFAMCTDCRREHDDPADRRFHAQPIACPCCGPELVWSVDDRRGPAALRVAAEVLTAGGLVAVKGVGGYHLACDAGDERTVARLRAGKRRHAKPFAVMVADAETARALCVLTAPAEQALMSPRRPVVLAPRRPDAAVAPSVAPALDELGVMLPSSPLHVLLLGAVGRPLVMTSGNLTDEPIAVDDDDARTRLGPLVDGVLSHDRRIVVRQDDSVVRSAPDGRLQVLRRARGWVPQPLRLPVPADGTVLAVGAQLKSTVTLAQGGSAVVSQHLGDLDHFAACTSFCEAVEHLVRLSGAVPGLVAHDLHPEYRSTAWARDSGLPLLGVQHHHAHVAACLTEHGRAGPVLGIAFDGMGLGPDGGLWGGELLLADLATSRRVGHLRTAALPGGDAAVREPWRMALAWLARALGEDVAAQHGPSLDDRWRAVLSLAVSGRSPETSSAGRLFDAVAAVVGVRGVVSYEGQAAVELEALARRAGPRPPTFRPGTADDVLDPAPALAALLDAQRRGTLPADLAAGFHRGLAASTAELAVVLAGRHGVDTVALSGGVFANVLLTDLLAADLRAAGLEVLVHEQLPPGDGSISVGQAAVAAAALASGDDLRVRG